MKYQLEIRAEIRELDNRGHPMYHNALVVNEIRKLGELSFIQMTGILGKLHDLMTEMREDVSE